MSTSVCMSTSVYEFEFTNVNLRCEQTDGLVVEQDVMSVLPGTCIRRLRPAQKINPLG